MTKQWGCRIVLGFALLLLASASTYAADKPMTAVADLRYGVSLYHYYQNENLQALSELLVAQQRGGIQGHGDNPEIMQGGFSMAYGMERKATEIFERLLDSNRPKKTRDAAWYYLAKMSYQRGDLTTAESIAQNISPDPHKDLSFPINLLRFNLDVRQGRLVEALNRINDVSAEDPERPYMLFNLGSAYSRQQLYAKGVESFSELLEMRQRTPEHLALYDKAMTAAGYAFLLQKQYAPAMEHFRFVRLDSPLSNRALLGYGWAALETENYPLALKPWQALAKRSLVDENTQEVLVAIPYAYEKMGYLPAALRAFQTAENNYLAEIQRLDEVIQNVQGYAIREALKIERSQDFDWLSHAQKNSLSPQLSYLVPLFSRDVFASTVQELRDLLAIQEQFNQWQGKLVFYGEMLDEREQNRVLEMDYLQQKQLTEQVAQMEAKRDEYAELLAQIGKDQDIAALVSPEEQPKIERILRAEKNAKILMRAAREQGIEVMPMEELEQLSETVRLQKGALLWKTSEYFDQRYWRVKRGLAQLNSELTSIRATQKRIANVVEKGFDLDPYRRRIAQADGQLLSQLVDIELAIEQSQNRLRDQVLAVLQQQRERLYHYLAQSRLSIARLLDQVSEANIDGEVPAEAEISPVDNGAAETDGGEVAQ